MDLESKQLINENKKSRKIIEPLKNNNIKKKATKYIFVNNWIYKYIYSPNCDFNYNN